MKNIKTFCQKYGISEVQFHGGEKILGDLDLCGLTAIPDGFNPTVGGGLDLRGLTAIPDGFNPTVGGGLYLSGLTAIPDGFNPTVGGGLYLSGLTAQTKTPPLVLAWPGFLKADGRFSRVIAKHALTDGNVWKLDSVKGGEEHYLLEVNGFCAHGKTVQEARDSLVFKVGSRDLTRFADTTTETVLSFAQAVDLYRAVTGACEEGTREFVRRRGVDISQDISVSRMLEITQDEYGHTTFKDFFLTKP
jgi:hypothetical protein